MFPALRTGGWLLLGVVSEVIVVAIAYLTNPAVGEFFRHAARYSGRASFLAFMLVMVLAGLELRSGRNDLHRVRGAALAFALMHFIHLGLLIMNVLENGIVLVPYRLVGGALAYAMILVYPFMIGRLHARSWVHPVFFLYVGAIMIITFLSQINGGFEGVNASWVHYAGSATVLVGLALFGLVFVRHRDLKGGSGLPR